MTPLVAALRSLPIPATHPSHPASPAIWDTLKEAQKGYAEMRGQWCRRCIDSQSHRVMDRIETMEAIEGGKEFGRWVDNFLNYIEVCMIYLSYTDVFSADVLDGIRIVAIHDADT